jgi:acyl carrier protein
MSEQARNTADTIMEFIRSHYARARTDSFTPHANLLESGIVDSMGLLDVIAFLEHTFNIRVAEEDLVAENFGTAAALAAYVERQVTGQPSPAA